MTIRKPILTSKSSLATAWAVYLGCATARRLAREWDITITQASRRLNYATCAGVVERVGYGEYRSGRPTRAARLAEKPTDNEGCF